MNVEKKIVLDPFMTIDEVLKKIGKVINALTNSYTIKKKRNGQDIQTEKTNMFKVVAFVEQILERQLSNIYEMSVAHWLTYEEMAKEKQKAFKQFKDHGGKR